MSPMHVSIRSSLRVATPLLALALLALLAACGSEPTPPMEPAPPSEPPPAAPEPAPAPAPAPEPEVEPTAEEVPVADDFFAEAEEQIDEKSYRKELDALEKELQAEAKLAVATP